MDTQLHIDDTGTALRGRAQPPRSKEEPSFASLGLHDALLRALREAGYEQPTPVQRQAIPPALEGRDVLACAHTGTGKTAAFMLPILQRLLGPNDRRRDTRQIRALVLVPTRELAGQIADSAATYGRGTDLRHLAIFGGISPRAQVTALKRGVDVLIATPGRLLDLLDQGFVCLSNIETLVLDEFDRMLDQGFLPAIRRIVRLLPERRQTLLFSATTPAEQESVVRKFVREPVRVSVHKNGSTNETVAQSVRFVERGEKRAELTHILQDPAITCAMVFTRTKHGADRVVKHLTRAGIEAEAIHGNKSQAARQRALGRFRTGTLRVLVATDVASRGIDIDGISHVINFDLPSDCESYVHRIGRTARAGRSGTALSLCSLDERGALRRIERLIGQRLPEHAGA